MPIDLPVFIEASAEVAGSPRFDARAAVEAWAHAMGKRAVEPTATPTPATIAFDAAVHDARVMAIERSLRAVRDRLDLGVIGGGESTGGHDGASPQSSGEAMSTLEDVDRRLAVVVATIRAHPEDPEAAWLLATALRSLARAASLRGDRLGAAALGSRAACLDGGEAPSLSESIDAADTSRTEPLSRADLAMSPDGLLVIDGPSRGLRARIDGRIAPFGAPIRLAAGEHQLRVVLVASSGGRDEDGATVSARWVSVRASTEAPAHVRVAEEPPACSEEDVEEARFAVAHDPSATFRVQCGEWAIARAVAATAGAPRGVEVRACNATSCGLPSLWLVDPIAREPPPVATPDHTFWSSPWTYVAIGAGAAAIGAAIAWRTGAFDHAAEPPPSWRWDGIK